MTSHITKGSVLKANLVSQYDSLGATSVTWNMFAISTVYNKKWLLIAKTFHDVVLLTPDFLVSTGNYLWCWVLAGKQGEKSGHKSSIYPQILTICVNYGETLIWDLRTSKHPTLTKTHQPPGFGTSHGIFWLWFGHFKTLPPPSEQTRIGTSHGELR